MDSCRRTSETERLLQLVLLGSCGGRSKSDSESQEGRATRTTSCGHVVEFEDRTFELNGPRYLYH